MTIFAMVILSIASSGAQVAEVEYRSVVAAGGWFPWYELAPDPADPANLILCGSRWDAGDNAFYGFVYSTIDGGRSWRTALEDRNSTWVSEQSCAFGVRDEAYFVSEASQVIDGRPYHNRGTTRIFLSRNAGRTWTEAAKTTWADYSASVVDTRDGVNQNRLYTFYNDVYPDVASDRGVEAKGTAVSAFSFKDDEINARGPLSLTKFRYQGSYPQRAFILKDGSLIATYFSRLRRRGREYAVIGAVRSNSDRTQFSDDVIVQVPLTKIRNCYPDDFAAAYDLIADRILIAYPWWNGGECRLFLKSSQSGASRWTIGRPLPYPRTKSRRFFSPAMAVSRDGILGFLWRDEPVSDCWYFSASRDNGHHLITPIPLAACSQRKRQLTDFGASLRTSMSAAGAGLSGPKLTLQLVDSRNHTWRNLGSLAVTADGAFHAAWVEGGGGNGELKAATILVTHSGNPAAVARVDVTDRLVPLYGGAQYYDRNHNTVTVQIALRNKSTTAIRAPLLLSVLGMKSGIGELVIVNSSNGLSNLGATWDVSKALPGGCLEPGDATAPIALVFQIPRGEAPAGEVEVVSLQFKALAAASEMPD
jgi:hypothetical protein